MQQMILPADGTRRQFEPLHAHRLDHVEFCINADERRYGKKGVYELSTRPDGSRQPVNQSVDLYGVRGDVRVRLLVHGEPVSLETDDYEAFLLALAAARGRVRERHEFVAKLADGGLVETSFPKTETPADIAQPASPVR